MADGSDAIADWPLLNALVNTASGASWVSIHHGGGVGIGRSIHAGQVCVADGTELAGQKLERVLTNDPAMGVLRHVDAGYPEADVAAERTGLVIPMAALRAPHPARRTDSSAGVAPAEAEPVKTRRRRPTACVSPAPGPTWPRSAGTSAAAATPGTSSTTHEMQMRDWFVAQAQRRGLATEVDRNGNIWAWWGEPGTGRRRHRLAPRLRPGRRRVRRAAGRRVRAPGRRRAAAPRASGPRARWLWSASPRKRAAGSVCRASGPG